MADEFDAYYKWFGIPPEQQPPNHYRLLGVPLFVDDDDVIEAAADQRMMLLRSYQSGARGSLSQKLLNEVSNAKVCLLNPARKAPYDAQLQLAIARDKLKKKAARPNMAEPALKVGIPIRDAARPLPQQTPIPVQVPAETKQRRLFGRVDMGSAPSIGIDTQFEADGNRAHSDRSALSHRRRKSKKETMIIASVAVVMVLTCWLIPGSGLMV